MYALVENGQVTSTGALPEAWNRADGTSVSGYNTLSDADVKLDGWYPLVENRPALSVGQVHSGPAYTVRTDDVLATYTAVAEPVTATNQRSLETKLADLLADAAAAQALLQAQRDTANIAAGTLTTAVLSNTVRALQAAAKEQAMLQQQHMKRTVAIARLLSGALDSTADT